MKLLPLWDQLIIKLLREVSPGAAHTRLHRRGSLLVRVGLSARYAQAKKNTKHNSGFLNSYEIQWK